MKAITTMKLIRNTALLLMATGSFHATAQIGVNTLTPDNSAALDIQPSSTQPNSGLLIPRLNQAQRTGVPGPAKGLMVFDLNDNLFYVNMSAAVHNWFAINPWQTKASSATSGPANVMYTHSTVTNVGIGISTPSEKLEVAGKIKATAVKVDSVVVPGFANNALVPTGAIIMWSGTTAPPGWALCDGAGGRPDLRGRFVIGYDVASPTTPTVAPNDGVTVNYGTPGNKGGETGHVLSKAELPKHQHTVNTSATDGGSISVGSSGFGFLSTAGSLIGMSGSNYSADSYDHSHSISGTTGNGTSDGLNNQVHENRPPYYVLAYIIKLP